MKLKNYEYLFICVISFNIVCKILKLKLKIQEIYAKAKDLR
jgi:hypothetical protein